MSYMFSDHKKYSIWRRLWVILAKAQKELDVEVSQEAIDEMEANVDRIDFDLVEEEERRSGHDVLAHIEEFAFKCPSAAHLIGLGTSSCYVGDNGDLWIMRDAIDLLLVKLRSCIQQMSDLAAKYANVAAIGYTHLQPSGIQTVGKRVCLWISDLLIDLNNLQRTRSQLRFRGCKGALGTQQSLLQLFDGDSAKVQRLDRRVSELADFDSCFSICGPSYSRKIDSECLSVLSSLAGSVHKMCIDLRLLCSYGEFELIDLTNESSGSTDEPQSFVSGDLNQTHRSSAIERPVMPAPRTQQKRAALYFERCCALSRHLWALHSNSQTTAASQWLERTSDDSTLRRVCVPEAFLTADALIQSLSDICSSLTVCTSVIERELKLELPNFIMSTVLDKAMQVGLDTAKVQKRIQTLQKVAAQSFRSTGQKMNLEQEIREDALFRPLADHFDFLFNPSNYVGCCEQQVCEFLQDEVRVALQMNVK